MTYYGGETPQPSGIAPFDGVALLNAAAVGAAGGMPAGTPPGMPPGLLPGTGQPMQPALGMPMAGQPSTEALRQQAAAVIQRCYRWLEAVVPAVPQFATLVPAMITAVQQYEAQQYAVCLSQAITVAETIRQLQATVPGLPAL